MHLVSVFDENIAPTMSCTCSVDNWVLVSVALIVNVSPDVAVVQLVPPAIVSVSPGVIPVDPPSLATVRSATTKSMSPVPS